MTLAAFLEGLIHPPPPLNSSSSQHLEASLLLMSVDSKFLSSGGVFYFLRHWFLGLLVLWLLSIVIFLVSLQTVLINGQTLQMDAHASQRHTIAAVGIPRSPAIPLPVSAGAAGLSSSTVSIDNESNPKLAMHYMAASHTQCWGPPGHSFWGSQVRVKL